MVDKNKTKLNASKVDAFLKKHWFVFLVVTLVALEIALFFIASHNDEPYSVILCIYVGLFLTIVTCMYGLIHLRIKRHFARNIEIFGYAILLVLLVRSAYISDDSQLMTKIINLEMKMDYVFSYISTSNESSQIRLVMEYGDTYDTSAQREYWIEQEKFNETVTLVLKILSTGCIAIGRFDDISSKKKKNEEPVN